MPDPWDPPLDTSGGFFIAQYTNGVRTHKQRLHVDHFTPATQQYTAPSATETFVSDTIAAWWQVWKLHYTVAWTISNLELWAIIGGVPVLQAPPPLPTPVVGTAAGPEAETPAQEQIVNMKTGGGHAARIILISAANLIATAPFTVNNASGAPWGATMTYLSGINTKLVGHDGQHFVDFAKITVIENRRLRRRYGLN